MSTHFVCPICSKVFECGPHPGPSDLAESIHKCPLEKGSLYIFVKDTADREVPDVKTFCGKEEGTLGTTDGAGFTYYNELKADTYSTSIDLNKSTTKVKDKYYANTSVDRSASVVAGKTTIVQYILNRYASLTVVLERDDGEKALPLVTFTVTGDGHSPDDPERKPEERTTEYKKLKPTVTYTATCALAKKEDEKNFKLLKTEEPSVHVKPDIENKVVFKVEPRYWIDVAFKDQKDPALKGKFSFEHSASGKFAADEVLAEFTHVPDLKPGTASVESVVLDVSREFGGIS